MNWKFWKHSTLNTQRPTTNTKFVLHGYTEAQMRQAFLSAPDSDLFKGTLELCDQHLMETVNELVNQADSMTDGVMRQHVGQMRGITELRELLEQRAAQARVDSQALQEDRKPEEDGG